MRELRSCDFCDAEAVGAFEAVPAELDPADGERRRVVLCLDCRNRLETLLEPLLARLGVDADGESSGTVVASAGDSTERPERTGSSNATVSSPDADRSAGASSSGGITFDDDSAADATTESSEGGDPTTETTETDSSPTAADRSTAATDEFAAGRSSDATETIESVRPDATDETDDERDENGAADARASASTAAASTPDRPPRAYAKGVRLLRNRDFPMERDAVEQLIAGAYDLEAEDAGAIVDHAIENGEFADRNGTLHRP
ncbi:hypothetical protein [Natrarchaeobius oligotrophus]|uniref:Uncharacterized protein n=1 Tax=Natrarchaeobius chitinivorans TaxID=1679083 RepID=A0A3N6PD02_NATCH|nr:hypothetical protein [Natrarchaeobius chitinivorans]RQG97459.1 hypothetical protein EA472_19040 [Natrarchaeobius chitinivorans]